MQLLETFIACTGLFVTFAFTGVASDCWDPARSPINICVYSYVFRQERKLLDGHSANCNYQEENYNLLTTCLGAIDLSSQPECVPYKENWVTTLQSSKILNDKLICSATNECSLRGLFECYNPLLTNMGIDIPSDPMQLPSFLDNLIVSFYSNKEFLCSDAAQFPSTLTTCLATEAATYAGNCFPGTDLANSGDLIKSMTSFQSSGLDETKQSLCNGGCSDFKERYAKFVSCRKTFLDDLVKSLQADSITNLNMWCPIANKYLACAGGSGQGCPILKAAIAADSIGVFSTCSIDVSAGIEAAEPFSSDGSNYAEKMTSSAASLIALFVLGIHFLV